MARGVNKAIIVGNLGADPQVRYMPSGSAVTNLSVATTDTWKDRQTGQPQEVTEWHRITLYNRLAEIAGQYLRKGSKVFIEGSLRTRKWQDKSGQERYTTEIIANKKQKIHAKAGGKEGAAPDFDEFSSPTSPPPFSAAEFTSKKAPEGAVAATAGEFDDDIPF